MKKNVLKNIVIILNYNSSDLTIKLINGIYRYFDIHKIIVVDNNSAKEEKDKLSQMKSFNNVNIIYSNENKGYAAGNNIGLRFIEKNYKDTDNVIIANPDVYFTEETLSKMIMFSQSFPKESFGMVAPIMLLPDEPESVKVTGFKIANYLDDLILSSPILVKLLKNPLQYSLTEKDVLRGYKIVDTLPGSFFLVNFDAFKKIGFFDEYNFLYSEERTIGHLLKFKGYKSYNLLNCYFLHDHSKVIKANIKKKKSFFLIGDSRINFQRKYHSIGRIKQKILKLSNQIGWIGVKLYDIVRK